MHSDELRRCFVGYFQRHHHLLMPGASLVPVGDSVLFTSAGMQQFAPCYLGTAHPPAPRIVTIQRCVRTSDIDEVGDDTHHTFFEMLGNFSFGDYFKKEAIAFAYELVTAELGFPADRLWVTIFAGEAGMTRDDEAEAAWRAVGLPAERIRAFGRDENWWGPVGESGPCGPDSEIHMDRGPAFGCGRPLDHCGPNHCGRFVEVWNLVFNQYHQAADGTLTPLQRTGIDTGVGFERLAALLQHQPSAYETDLFAPLVLAAAAQTDVAYGADPASDRSLRIIADHLRAATFLVADGVIPTNEGRGYVVRRLVRRAVALTRLLGGTSAIIRAVAGATINRMSHYPHLEQKRTPILRVLSDEADQFIRTLDGGTSLLMVELSRLKDSGQKVLSGDMAFRLHDTYGFPLPLTVELADMRGIRVDTAAFAQRMEEQRARSRAAQRVRALQCP